MCFLWRHYENCVTGNWSSDHENIGRVPMNTNCYGFSCRGNEVCNS
jgi:hypothetical protein